MENELSVLQLRILMCFFHAGAEGCSVSSLSKTFEMEKQAVSRLVIKLDQMGLVSRENIRHPILTEKGKTLGAYYAERMETAISHLKYEGVDSGHAKEDAYYWALYNSEETMDVIRATEERYRIKYEMRDKKRFTGDQLCRQMKNGTYQFPCLIYREKMKNGNILSMGNDGFRSPCTLNVKDGKGVLQLYTVQTSAVSAFDGMRMKGKVKSLKYLKDGGYSNAEMAGNIITIPASALRFVNTGMGMFQILHGSVCIKISVTVGPMHMPESTAVLTLLV